MSQARSAPPLSSCFGLSCRLLSVLDFTWTATKALLSLQWMMKLAAWQLRKRGNDCQVAGLALKTPVAFRVHLLAVLWQGLSSAQANRQSRCRKCSGGSFSHFFTMAIMTPKAALTSIRYAPCLMSPTPSDLWQQPCSHLIYGSNLAHN